MKIKVKKELGKLGEQLATEYLEKNQYKIIDRNFCCRQGEIDIIAKDKTEIVFIEVKTRTNNNFGSPSEAVNTIKKYHMYNSAKYFLYKHNLFEECIRFDVIEVLVSKGKFNINHIKQIM